MDKPLWLFYYLMLRTLVISGVLSALFIFTSLIIPFLVNLFTTFSLKAGIQSIFNIINVTGIKVLCITFFVNMTIFFGIAQVYISFKIAEYPFIDIGLSILMLFLILSYSFILSPILSVKLNKRFIYNAQYSEFISSEFKNKIIVRIVDCDLKNAYATGVLPSYKIILLGKPLLDKMSDIQLKGIILHEYAHNKYNHILKMYLISIFGILLNFTLFYFLSKLNLSINDAIKYAIFGALGGLINFQLLPNLFKKRFEYQADLFAASFVGKKNYEETLLRLDEITGGLLKKGNSSHPTLEKRIANIYGYEK